MKNISLLGIPYDKKSSFMRGPSSAPERIRECLHSHTTNLYAENGLSIDSERIKDEGDISVKEYFDIQTSIEKILSSESRVLSLGGDHSISFPINYFP